METVWQDLRYAARMLRKNLGFTTIAILALALGIGANSAIFTVINAVLLNPLPFPEPERIIAVWGTIPQDSSQRIPSSIPDFKDYRAECRSFEKLAAYAQTGAILTGETEPLRLSGVVASAELWPILGIKPQLGRVFTAEDDQPDAAPVVMLSNGFWRQNFGADDKIIGKTVTLDSKKTTIIGVMPAEFNFPFGSRRDYWQPLMPNAAERATRRGVRYLNIIGQLKTDISISTAQADLNTIVSRLAQQYPETNSSQGLKLKSLHEDLVGDFRPALLVLFVAVGFVLLIACANVANLLLARATVRQREMAIRAALGAGRRRIIQQLLTESVMLSLLGGIIGLLLALWGADLLLALSPTSFLRAQEIGIDWHVLGFTFLISVVTGIVFGLVPALQISRLDLNESLKDGSRGASEGLRRNRMRSTLVVIEVALSLVLMIGAGLLIKSFLRLQEVNIGFNPENILSINLPLPKLKYPEDQQQRAFYQKALAQIAAVPGVESAAAIFPLPLSGNNRNSSFVIAGAPPVKSGDDPQSNFRLVSPDYFHTMQIAILKGRVFTEHDESNSAPVVVINKTLAHQYFPGEDPIGRRIITEDDGPEREIIGIVADVRHEGLDQPANPEYYISYLQESELTMSIVVRSKTADPKGLVASLREAVRQVDKDQPISTTRTMDEWLAATLAQRRFNMLLLGIFAAVALILSAVGIYGVMAYSVTQRTHELGIRMALGAQSGDIFKLVIGEGMLLAIIGVAVGLLASFGLTRLISGLLYGVSTTDMITFLLISICFIAVAMLACYIPARRATRVDPMIALRCD